MAVEVRGFKFVGSRYLVVQRLMENKIQTSLPLRDFGVLSWWSQ